MSRFIADPRPLAKFFALTFGILMLGSALTSLVFSRMTLLSPLLIALACAIVSAWSLNLYFEILKYELTANLMRRMRPRRRR